MLKSLPHQFFTPALRSGGFLKGVILFMKCFKYIIVLAIALLIYNPDDTYALSTIYVDTGSTEYDFSTNSGYYETDAGDYMKSNNDTLDDSLVSCINGYDLNWVMSDYFYNGFDSVLFLPNFMEFTAVYDESGNLSIYATFTDSAFNDYVNSHSNNIYYYYGAVTGDSSRICYQYSNNDLKPKYTSKDNFSTMLRSFFNYRHHDNNNQNYILRCDFDDNNTDIFPIKVYSLSNSDVVNVSMSRGHFSPFYLEKKVADFNMPKIYVPSTKRKNLDYGTINFLRKGVVGQYDETSLWESLPSVSSAILDGAGTLTIPRSNKFSDFITNGNYDLGSFFLKIEGTLNFDSLKTNEINTVNESKDGDAIYTVYNENSFEYNFTPVSTGYGILDVWFRHSSSVLEPSHPIRQQRFNELVKNGFNSSYDYRLNNAYHVGNYGIVGVSSDADYIKDRVTSAILNNTSSNLSAPFIRLGLINVPYANLDCEYDISSYYKQLYQYCSLIALMNQNSPIVRANSVILKLSYVYGYYESKPSYLVFANGTSYFFEEEDFKNAGFINPDYINLTSPYNLYSESPTENASNLGTMLYTISINNNIIGGGSGSGSASGGTASAIGINGDVNNSSSVGDINISVPNSSSAGSSSSGSSVDLIPFSFSPDAGIWSNLKNGISSGFGLLGNDGTVDTLSNVFRWFDPQGVLKGVLLTGLMLCIVIGIIKFVKP